MFQAMRNGEPNPGAIMTQSFYAQEADERRCLESINSDAVITIIGRTADGKTRPFRGTVGSIERGHSAQPGYPLKITMRD
jgi:hypothetical protein